MLKLFFSAVLLCVSHLLSSQEVAMSGTNRKELLRIATYQDSLFQTQLGEYQKSIPKGRRIPSYANFNGLDASGRPKYLINHNKAAGVASNIDALYNEGSLGVSLKGMNMKVGIWEIGAPLSDHIEYSGRLLIKDQAAEISNHATHVTGTVIAQGLNEDARGVAHAGSVDAYSASGYLSEIAVAAADGLLVSNHSYGASAGYNSSGEWLGDPNISTQEDWKFGIYDSEASTLDRIAFNAPYYLLIRSAGNENGESGSDIYPPDGPYDCMTGEATAKNILAVGNVIKTVEKPSTPGQIVLRSSSSWGPTDDGRIKPDLVATGSNVLSSSSNGTDSYASLSGTSMSSPLVSGAAILLQELYHRYNGKFIRSATLKAILLHATKEAGVNSGPDYSYGYGMMNAEASAKLITENGRFSKIIEATLVSKESHEFSYFKEEDEVELVVSLSWTDPEGTPITTPILDPEDIKLVNDLDVKIIDEDGTEYYPWRLNPASPSAAATKGDNIRDNYEKIQISEALSGEYKIIVSHKGELRNDKQDYSLIISTTKLNNMRRTLYWIGNSGEWGNSSNWSLSSGGTPANSLPTKYDRVVFNEDGIAENDNVVLSSSVEVYQLSWLVDNQSGITQNEDTIMINGSAHIEGTIKGENILCFSNEANAPINAYISKSNLELDLLIDSDEAEFYLTGEELELGTLTVESGVFRLNKDLNVKKLDFSSSKIDSVNLDNIVIRVDTMDFGTLDHEKVSFSNTSIFFTGESNYWFSQPGYAINRVQLDQGSLGINADLEIRNLHLENGTSLVITDQKNIKVDTMNIRSTAEKRVSIQSSGLTSFITGITNSKFCYDFVDVTNVSIQGETKFVLQGNSNVSNGDGWIMSSCEEVLFSRFDIESPCANGTTFFKDKSEGIISNWLWDFGNGNTSEEQNPTFIFNSKGLYTVSLTVSNDVESHTIFKEINVIDFDIARPVIEEKNGRLITNSQGQLFQWYLNDEPIEGETSRVLTKELELGSYTVLSTDGICLSFSDAYLIEPLGNDKLTYQILGYPNPVIKNSIYHIDNLSVNENYQVTMTNSLGKIVLKENVNTNSQGEMKIRVPGNAINGLYNLQLRNERLGFHALHKILIK